MTLVSDEHFMTEENAKDFLETLMAILQTGVGSDEILRNDYCRSARTSIFALEKRIPRKPYFQNGRFYCPCCKGNKNSLNLFCDDCGQAIDWRNNNGR